MVNTIKTQLTGLRSGLLDASQGATWLAFALLWGITRHAFATRWGFVVGEGVCWACNIDVIYTKAKVSTLNHSLAEKHVGMDCFAV